MLTASPVKVTAASQDGYRPESNTVHTFPSPDAHYGVREPLLTAAGAPDAATGQFWRCSFLFFSFRACFVRLSIHRLWTFLLCQNRLPGPIYLHFFGCTSEPHVRSSAGTCYRELSVCTRLRTGVKVPQNYIVSACPRRPKHTPKMRVLFFSHSALADFRAHTHWGHLLY